MKRRRIDPQLEMAAVLEVIRGDSSIADMCRKYQISETLFYRWRDKFLEAWKKGLAERNGDDAPVKARFPSWKG